MADDHNTKKGIAQMHWCNLKPLMRGAKLLGAAIVYLWSVSAHAADPVYCASDADIVLTTQAQVDGFQETRWGYFILLLVLVDVFCHR